MAAGQSSGTGAMTEIEDEKVRKNDILSNRDKAQRKPGRSLLSVRKLLVSYESDVIQGMPLKLGGHRCGPLRLATATTVASSATPAI